MQIPGPTPDLQQQSLRGMGQESVFSQRCQVSLTFTYMSEPQTFGVWGESEGG